jgi:hypothetical protein
MRCTHERGSPPRRWSAQMAQRSYASAMAMLCLYINRAGRKLDPLQRQVLEAAKQRLREQAEQNVLPE